MELQRDLAGEALMTSALALLVGRASDTSDLLHSFLKRWVAHTFCVLSALFARPRDGFWELEVETCMGMLVTSNPSGMCDWLLTRVRLPRVDRGIHFELIWNLGDRDEFN